MLQSVYEPTAVRNIEGKEEFVEIATMCDAYFMHTGDGPHVGIRGGLCSNGCLRMENILQYPIVSMILAREMISNLPGVAPLDRVTAVVGASDTMYLAKDVANELGVRHVFLEVGENGEEVLHPDHRLCYGDTVLHVEGMINSGKTALAVRDALRGVEGINVIPYIPAVAARPTIDTSLTPRILAEKMFFVPVYNFDEFTVTTMEECELCASGSRRVYPEAWDVLLTAK